MPATTHPEFDAHTEALEVAEAFKDRIKGRTILVTGVNLDGIGYTTAQAFVRLLPSCQSLDIPSLTLRDPRHPSPPRT